MLSRGDGFGWRILDTLWRDGKHALRRLKKDWQFSAGAVAILALGIGANTAVFSILNSTLLLPHPFAHSERLVNVYQNDAKTGEPEGVSYPAFVDLQQETAVFRGVAAYVGTEGRYQSVDAHGTPGAIRGGFIEYASASYLEVLGMQPHLGRWFSEQEDRAAAPVAVLGWMTWTRNFGADPTVLGRTVFVDGNPVQVIGVGPMALNNSETNPILASMWLPIRRSELQGARGFAATRGLLVSRENLFLQVRARLRDGVSVPQAQAVMNVTAKRNAAEHPDTDPKRGITVVPTDDVRVHPRIDRIIKPIAAVVLTVVGLVLAIACSNLATLLLVRSSARANEVSVRLALGATRWQLVRYLLMESFVLSLAGAAVGVVVATWGLRYLATIDMPLIITMQLDYRVLGFIVGIAIACGVGFGMTPALQVTRVDLAGALREERGSSGRALSLARGWFTPKNVLITGQVAASFLLLVGAMLALNILTATQERSVGYRPEGLAIIELDPRQAGYDMVRATTVLAELKNHVASMPGVESVFVTHGIPVDGQFDKEFRLDGTTKDESYKVEGRWTGPGYFHTLGIPVLFGRVFDERDSADSPEVVVVSEAFGRRYFGTPNAVGRRLRLQDVSRPVEIVGVVGNARSIDMVADAPESYLYRSAAQNAVMPTTIVARTSQNELALVGLLQTEIRRLRPELPVTNALTMKQRQEMELVLFRVAVMSLGALGGLGLLLTGVGLYAVVGYAVAQRFNELGIRIALGARPGDLTWIVVRDVSALMVAGIVTGLALSWMAVTLLESSVAQIIGVDLLALAPVAVMIVACGAVAAYMPARRAVLTDPIAAIRHQ